MAARSMDSWDDDQPPTWLGRLRAVASRGAGLLLVGLALYLGLALAGFNNEDPSWNQATDSIVRNPAGPAGAVVADILLQTFGRASWILPLVAVALGLRRLLDRPPRYPWLPTLAMPPALLASSAWFASLTTPPFEDWPLFVGLGGVVGDYLFHYLRPELGAVVYGWGTALLALALIVASIGLRMGESAAMVKSGWHAGVSASSRIGAAGRAGGSRVAARWRGRAGGDDRDEGDDGDDVLAPPTVAAVRSRRRPPRPAAEPVTADEIDQETRTFFERIREKARARGEPRDVAGPPEAGDTGEVIPQPRRSRRKSALEPVPPVVDEDGYVMPSLDFLVEPKGGSTTVSQEILEDIRDQLETVLDDFGVRGEIIDCKPGPVITLFELEPAPGTRSQRVINLASDIALSLSAVSMRIATVPGRKVIGIELPNERRQTVYLRDILESRAYLNSEAPLAMALGKDISGTSVIVDLATMPHLLIAGTTGSGKSVAINAIILSLVFRLKPEECRFIMIDPKVIELSIYDGIPHLLAPVVTEPHKAVVALKWVVRAMDERYRLMSHLGVRDIFAFNKRIREAKARGDVLMRRVRTGFEPGTGAPIYEDQPMPMEPLPLIVVIVDEVADLMLTAGKEVENAIQRLSQKARAAGIHLIVATQRPSVDVITGVIKANLPARISFRVSSKIDSRTVLGDAGAEQLLGRGDMLYLMPGDRIMRVHGALVTDGEVEAVVNHLRAQGEPDYDEEVTADAPLDAGGESVTNSNVFSEGGGADALYQQAVQIVARDGKASTSYLQRQLSIGYNSAAKLIERMEKDGLISSADHVGRRRVLMGRGGVDGDTPTSFDEE